MFKTTFEALRQLEKVEPVISEAKEAKENIQIKKVEVKKPVEVQKPAKKIVKTEK